MELHAPSTTVIDDNNATTGWTVHTDYIAQPLVLPFCNGQLACPYELFRNYMHQYAINSDAEFASICTGNNTNSIISDTIVSDVTPAHLGPITIVTTNSSAWWWTDWQQR